MNTPLVRSPRVLAVMEASTVTGPARNLIQFCRGCAASAGNAGAADLSIVTFVRNDAAANQFTEAVAAAGVSITCIPERGPFDLSVLRAMKEVFEKHQPDLVQTHGVKSHFLMRLGGFHRRWPWIAYHHGYTAEDLKMKLYNKLNIWSLRGASRVVTVCRPFADSLQRIGVSRDRIEVLSNSIDPPAALPVDQARELRSQLGITPDERVVLTIGRLSTEKGHTYLLKAARLLAQLHPELRFRLVIVGTGIELGNLQNQAREAGLTDRIVFAGHHRDVFPWYAMADVFALPSLSEGSPNVVLEAMAVGLPVVATAVGGVPETMTDGKSGLMVPARDPQAMAQALAAVLMDAQLSERLRKGSREEILAFSPSAYRARLVNIYHDVLTASSVR